MTLQAIFLGWSGVLINDESLQVQAINRLLLQDNLRPLLPKQAPDLGQADAERLRLIWENQGRILSSNALTALLQQKQSYYQQALADLPQLPLTLNVAEMLESLQQEGSQIVLVTDTTLEIVKFVLERADLASLFSMIVTGNDLPTDAKFATGYLHLLAMRRLGLLPTNCLGIEATYAGLAAGQSAGLQMLGLATLLPLHMLQRRADWVVDRFSQIEWDRLQTWFATGHDRPQPLGSSI